MTGHYVKVILTIELICWLEENVDKGAYYASFRHHDRIYFEKEEDLIMCKLRFGL